MLRKPEAALDYKIGNSQSDKFLLHRFLQKVGFLQFAMTPRGRSLLAATARIREAGSILLYHRTTDNHRHVFPVPRW